ncbi:MAG: Glycosyl transferase family 2 [Candidatus Roizmanbacteria bacterium GW2011_GWB1_40_7]|uniref:Glycosyl transferase family 2 n=3 Tax=Microgenomates group TaxID=1794810 RepID=A0A0G0VE49_9BACT|nr:MAG: Glycosyl transferase family 2 [Candidatus Roizmanbacteria bacterium GW2011_GWB1_40_7]KKR91040.1 MAG: Glycosyl transferase family 2 [Candidatus Roizmanbacteria bacterium GW2011_GWA1_41_13]KKS45631.1 MAG: Glycosyl transferase family 2 [Candidatus Gottesmanbacteria bacterium GW2011_GWA2_42_18]
MKPKKLTISVGTSAYNEESNIKHMLQSVLRQQGDSFILKEIMVISDGSSDTTVQQTKIIDDKRITMYDDGKRLGKPSRIRQLLEDFTADVFVFIDADTVMKDSHVLEAIAKAFLSNLSLSLIMGNTEPLPGKTFIEKAVNNYIYARSALEKKFHLQERAYGAHGFLAHSHKFGKSLSLPREVFNEDAFFYFAAISRREQVTFLKQATVLYRSPQTIRDHINQATRHIYGGMQLKEYFGDELVDAGFYVSFPATVHLLIRQLVRDPIGYIVLKILGMYCKYRASKKNSMLVTWTPISSSKHVF